MNGDVSNDKSGRAAGGAAIDRLSHKYSYVSDTELNNLYQNSILTKLKLNAELHLQDRENEGFRLMQSSTFIPRSQLPTIMQGHDSLQNQLSQNSILDKLKLRPDFHLHNREYENFRPMQSSTFIPRSQLPTIMQGHVSLQNQLSQNFILDKLKLNHELHLQDREYEGFQHMQTSTSISTSQWPAIMQGHVSLQNQCRGFMYNIPRTQHLWTDQASYQAKELTSSEAFVHTLPAYARPLYRQCIQQPSWHLQLQHHVAPLSFQSPLPHFSMSTHALRPLITPAQKSSSHQTTPDNQLSQPNPEEIKNIEDMQQSVAVEAFKKLKTELDSGMGGDLPKSRLYGNTGEETDDKMSDGDSCDSDKEINVVDVDDDEEKDEGPSQPPISTLSGKCKATTNEQGVHISNQDPNHRAAFSKDVVTGDGDLQLPNQVDVYDDDDKDEDISEPQISKMSGKRKATTNEQAGPASNHDPSHDAPFSNDMVTDDRNLQLSNQDGGLMYRTQENPQLQTDQAAFNLRKDAMTSEPAVDTVPSHTHQLYPQWIQQLPCHQQLQPHVTPLSFPRPLPHCSMSMHGTQPHWLMSTHAPRQPMTAPSQKPSSHVGHFPQRTEPNPEGMKEEEEKMHNLAKIIRHRRLELGYTQEKLRDELNNLSCKHNLCVHNFSRYSIRNLEKEKTSLYSMLMWKPLLELWLESTRKRHYSSRRVLKSPIRRLNSLESGIHRLPL